MKLTTAKVTQLTITDAQSPPNRGVLDPIRVIIEDYEPGRGSILISCFDAAWTAYFGAMGARDLRTFFLGCDPGYLADNLIRSASTARGKHHHAYLVRIARAVQAALRQQLPVKTPQRLAREERVKHANALIRVISDHGRRFFFNTDSKRVAHIELDGRGKLFWIDDYRATRVCMEKVGGYETDWRGFSHGGTLKDLARQMREYIKTGERISIAWICRQQLGGNGDIWGYGEAAAEATRTAAMALPIIRTSSLKAVPVGA